MATEITVTTLYGDRYNVATSNTSCILAVRKADHLNIKRTLRRSDWLASKYSLRVFTSYFCFYVKLAYLFTESIVH